MRTGPPIGGPSLRRTQRLEPEDPQTRRSLGERFPWGYLAVFLAGTAIIAAFMWYEIHDERRIAITTWEGRVSTIAEARAGAVSGWLRGRVADAELLAGFPLVKALLPGQVPGEVVVTPRSEIPRQLLPHLDRVAGTYGAGVVWVQDLQGRVVAQSTGAPAARAPGIETLLTVARTLDLRIELTTEDQRTRVVRVAAPVFGDRGGARAVLGVVTVRTDPTGLFALLADEAAPTRTGETLLFRLGGGEGGYLSPLRHVPGGWSALRRSLDLLTAASEGRETFFELTDYREVPVFAATRWIVPANWGLVYKIDRDEALAEFHRAGRLAGLAAAFLTMALGGLLVSLWRQQQRAFLLREQMKHERAIFALRGYSEQVVASIPSGLLVLSGDLRVLSTNRSFLDSFGLREIDVIGRELHEVVRTEGLIQRAREVLRSGSPQHDILFDLHLALRRDTRPVRITMTGIRTAEQEDARLLLIIQDLSEHERLRAARQESEQRFRDLVQGLDAIVWEADAETFRFSFVSERAEKVLGYPTDQWLKEPEFFATRFHPEDRERAIANFRDGMDTEFEYRAVAGDGRVVWLRDIVHVVRDDHGHPRQLRGVAVDVTERKQTEEALRQSEEQLRQAAKMDAIGKLAGGVAHDFNNLLMVISGRAELLLDRLSPKSSLRREILLIHQTAERAAALTNRLLAFGRKQVLQPKVLDLNAVVGNMRTMLQRLIGESVELVTQRHQHLGHVKADPWQIEQVILNLAVNARDAMPDGGRLTIETANAELSDIAALREGAPAAGPYVMLAVRDTGHGMAADVQSHLFEPFFTTKKAGVGTGLGLSTVYGIVKQSGGHISVESVPGEGATFKIFLPRVDEPVELVEEREFPPAAPGGNETILLVEDAHRVREVVRSMLAKGGYSVLVAQHGQEAIQISQQHAGPIHLMVTDVVMPEMSGRELAQRLASLRPEMKVVYMSGHTDNAIVHHGVLAPGTAFLQKPFTAAALARKVREVLDDTHETN